MIYLLLFTFKEHNIANFANCTLQNILFLSISAHLAVLQPQKSVQN